MTRDRPTPGGQDSTIEGEFPSELGGGESGKDFPETIVEANKDFGRAVPNETLSQILYINNYPFGGSIKGLYGFGNSGTTVPGYDVPFPELDYSFNSSSGTTNVQTWNFNLTFSTGPVALGIKRGAFFSGFTTSTDGLRIGNQINTVPEADIFSQYRTGEINRELNFSSNRTSFSIQGIGHLIEPKTTRFVPNNYTNNLSLGRDSFIFFTPEKMGKRYTVMQIMGATSGTINLDVSVDPPNANLSGFRSMSLVLWDFDQLVTGSFSHTEISYSFFS